MNKTISMLMILMSIVGILDVIFLGYEDIDVIIRITCILGISILELLNSLLKSDEKIINYLQLIIILVLMNFGFSEMSFLLPIATFKVIKNKTNRFTSILINIGIMAYLARVNFFYMAVYIIIVNLYLYEVKKQYEDGLELNAFNRGQRYESHLMENKIRNLERYLE